MIIFDKLGSVLKKCQRIMMMIIVVVVVIRERVQISVGNQMMGNGPDQFSN